MRVVLYARVSSEKQVEKDLSISAQLKALRKYAIGKEWEIYKEFIDEAQSARSAKRPSFQEMISLAKKKTQSFDAILVWKFSRFARNREDSIIYKSLLRKYGISVISINENLDDSPAGKLLEGMIEVIDEFYSLNLAQDTIRGMKENASRGFCNGGTAPVGYGRVVVKDGQNRKIRLEPDDMYAPIVRRIFEMCLAGQGAKEIVKTLNSEGLTTPKGKPWNKNNVYYILKNEVYTGMFVWNKNNKTGQKVTTKPNDEIIRVENNHPAIVDHKTFDRVQQLLKSRSPKKTHPRTVNSKYLLSSMLFCGKCTSAMIGSAAKSSQYFYYACQNYSKRGKDICDAKLINKHELEVLVIERIREKLLTEQNLRELVTLINQELITAKKRSGEDLKVLECQINKRKERLDKLYDALETGKLSIEDLAPRIKDLRQQIETLEARRTELTETANQTKIEILESKLVETYVSDLRGLLEKGTIMERKSFLKTFVKRIEVDYPNVTIYYTIPLDTKKAEPSNSEVLPITWNGTPGGTRTFNPWLRRPTHTYSVNICFYVY